VRLALNSTCSTDNVETLRTLKPGGQLGFTTWAYNRPMELAQQATSLLPTFPNTSTVEAYTRVSANGYWHDRGYVRAQLEALGLVDIKIESTLFTHGANSAAECAKMMWILVKIRSMALGGGEASRVEGWKLFDKIAEVLRLEQGDGPVKVSMVALVVTARKPE
jgi:hypothetical protein